MNEIRTEFTMDRERPPAVNAAGELEDQEPETVTYTALWYVEPAENGGRESPSYPAYPVVESVLDPEGKDVSDDRDVMVAADNAVNAAYNDSKHDGEEDFSPYMD